MTQCHDCPHVTGTTTSRTHCCSDHRIELRATVTMSEAAMDPPKLNRHQRRSAHHPKKARNMDPRAKRDQLRHLGMV